MHNGATLILQETEYCIGWQNSGMQTRDGKEITLLGGNFDVYSFSERFITYMNIYKTTSPSFHNKSLFEILLFSGLMPYDYCLADNTVPFH